MLAIIIGGLLMNIGNIETMAEEVKHFYPDRIHGAIGFIETRYNLDTFHASHIACTVWGLLNDQNPLRLPHFRILQSMISVN